MNADGRRMNADGGEFFGQVIEAQGGDDGMVHERRVFWFLEEGELRPRGPLGQALDLLQAGAMAEGVAGAFLQFDVVLKQVRVVASTVDEVVSGAEHAERAGELYPGTTIRSWAR